MIYLIGGPQGSGKSTLAKRLTEHKIAGVDTDSLRACMDISATEGTSEDHERLWEGVCRLIKSRLNYEGDYWIEGVHITPRRVQKLYDFFKEKYPEKSEQFRSSIKPVFLGQVGADVEDRIRTILLARETQWITQLPPEDLRHQATEALRLSKIYKEEAESLRMRFIDTGEEFESRIREAAEFLLNN